MTARPREAVVSKTIKAVYQDGVFRPEVPPDLPDGSAVQLAVLPFIPDTLPDGRGAHEILAAIAARSAKRGPRENTSENVDAFLYGVKGDRGDVR